MENSYTKWLENQETKLEIMESNKLIAEFMDIDEVDIDCAIEDYGELKYHTSWDWLMPVVEKIEGEVTDRYYKIQVNINEEECTIMGLRDSCGKEIIIDGRGRGYYTKKEATYQAVVEFINQLK